MNDAPKTWNLDCPWWGFYIVAAERSGAGEEAASMMLDHLHQKHPDRDWSDFISARAVSEGTPGEGKP